jgi:hypothetical protein
MAKKLSYSKLYFIFSVFMIFIFVILICFNSNNILKIFILNNEDKFDIRNHNLFTNSVVIYDENKSFNGFNICENLLLDMEGNLIKQSDKLSRFWLLYSNNKNRDIGNNYSDFFIFTKNVIDQNKIVILEKSSNETTENIINYDVHHDFSFVNLENSSYIPHFLAISTKNYEYMKRNVTFDVIYELDMSGNIIKSWSTYEHFDELHNFFNKTALDYLSDEKYESLLNRDDYQKAKDYFHVNYIQSIPNNIYEEKDSRFKAGNWLISLASVGLIAIIDYDSNNIVWTYGVGEIYGQHCTQMIDNGNILIFDNGYTSRNNSRVIEVNPITKKIVWEFNQLDFRKYGYDEFYTKYEGCAKKLPNNNTLITISSLGKVIEVSSSKEIVWEWNNPITALDSSGNNMATYRLIRVNKTEKDLILKLIS